MPNFQYQINNIQLKNNSSIIPGKINVFVGANNCGKTQLLKDMIAYITGKREPFIILDHLDVPYPQNWDIFQQKYDMPITESNGSQLLRHISPTLDQDAIGFSTTNIHQVMDQYLLSDKHQFRSAIGAGLVTYLNTDNRLRLAMSQPVQNLHDRGAKNVLEALYLSGNSSTRKARKIIKDIFGTDMYLDSSNLGMLQCKIGSDFSSITDNPQDAYTQLANYPLLDTQGDGIRSVLGIISSIIAVKKPILLLDEPEAFLHPPQAAQLGSTISELVEPDQQIFISTHSADFLRGLLSSTRDAVIIHISRDSSNNTNAKVLDSNALNQIITDPLLSSSRVLEGMFYKGVVATEADADAIFYQRLFQKIGSSDEIHFVNAHNKQTLKKLIEPYKKLGIKFAMISDADVIRDLHEFKNLLEIESNEELKSQILAERNIIYNYFHSRNKYETLIDLHNEIVKLTDNQLPSQEDTPEIIASRIFDLRSSLKKLRDESDELADFKKSGYHSLPAEFRQTFDNLWNHCSNIGLFIVKVGELESWLVDYGIDRTSNKSKWITKALNKLFEIEYDEEKEIWKFIANLKLYLTS